MSNGALGQVCGKIAERTVRAGFMALLSAGAMGCEASAPAGPGDAGVDAGRLEDVSADGSASSDVIRSPEAAGDGTPQWTPCGGPGQRCCTGERCDAGGCCVDLQCVEDGQPCGGSLATCSNGSCGSCGAVGQPCCPLTYAEGLLGGCSRPITPDCSGCTAAGAACPNDQPTDLCVACGSDGQPCCPGGWCTPALSACHPQSADASPSTPYVCTTQCGHEGEPCCQGDVCLNGACCMAGPQGSLCPAPTFCGCTNGRCTTCGIGACCPGSLCQSVQVGVVCASGNCAWPL